MTEVQRLLGLTILLRDAGRIDEWRRSVQPDLERHRGSPRVERGAGAARLGVAAAEALREWRAIRGTLPAMKLVHHPEAVAALRAPTERDPWRVLVSGCLTGMPCGVKGDDYGLGGCVDGLLGLPNVRAVPFCPEDHGIGTPRTMPDIHGGDGLVVLRGKARVLDEHGKDLTEGMLFGARAMVQRAQREQVDFAVLTDMSAACGSQVISDGCRFDEPRRFQKGFGVAAAALVEAGFAVVSQRDYATLGKLIARADPSYAPDPDALDHHEHPWTVGHFGPHVAG